MSEWRTAREPLTRRIEASQRKLQALSDSEALHALGSIGPDLADRWEGLDISRQRAIIKAVLDHAVINPAPPSHVFRPSRACRTGGYSGAAGSPPRASGALRGLTARPVNSAATPANVAGSATTSETPCAAHYADSQAHTSTSDGAVIAARPTETSRQAAPASPQHRY